MGRRAISISFEPLNRPCVGGQQLKRAGRHQRQTSGQDPGLQHVQLLCDVPVAHGVTDHRQGRVLPEQHSGQ